MSLVSRSTAGPSRRAMVTRLAAVCFAVSFLAIVACDDSRQEIVSSPTNAPQFTPTPTPDPTSPPPPTPRANLEERLDECAAALPDGADPTGVFNDCLTKVPDLVPAHTTTIPWSVTSSDGPIPLVAIDVPYGICQSQTFIAWREGTEGWQVQSTDEVLRESGVTSWPNQTTGSGTAARVPPRVISEDGRLYLGVIIGRAGCGSGPHNSYVLLSFGGREWRLSWSGPSAFAGLIGQTSVEFIGEGLETIHVSGTSLGRSDDKSGILSEHKLAPVRTFDQVWVRQGEEYALAEETVRASGSNTLLEFLYSLTAGDAAAASGLVTDPSIVATAQSLGLVRHPGETAWSWFCTDSEGRAFGPFVGWPCVVQSTQDSGFRFSFVETEADWLISAIQPCTYTYGAGGGRCD